MITPYMAAKAGIGEDRTAYIVRYKLDGTRSGLMQGRHAAWNWAYRVECVLSGESKSFDMGRGLVGARQYAATLARTIVENWPDGKTFVRGPSGGLHT